MGRLNPLREVFSVWDYLEQEFHMFPRFIEILYVRLNESSKKGLLEILSTQIISDRLRMQFSKVKPHGFHFGLLKRV